MRMFVPCSSRSREPTPALTPAYAFSSCEIKDFYVAIIVFVPCSSRSREPTPALTPAYAFSSCEIKDFYVAIIMFVPCSSRSREPTPALTPAYAFFLWPCPPVHTVRSFSGNLSLDARTFLTL